MRALSELQEMMGILPHCNDNDASTEAGASQRMRLEVAQAGGVMWRNNVGAMQDETGRWVRYGLANESQQMNRHIKSSDLIGIIPVRIEPHMVGTVIGQFIAREMKKPGWQYGGTPREVAQLKFIDLVLSKGGDASFSTGP
jgi:hypothetical protein